MAYNLDKVFNAKRTPTAFDRHDPTVPLTKGHGDDVGPDSVGHVVEDANGLKQTDRTSITAPAARQPGPRATCVLTT